MDTSSDIEHRDNGTKFVAVDAENRSMDPNQAADCLKAAAKLMTASWQYTSPGCFGVRIDMVKQALNIIATATRGIEHYLD